MSQFPAYVAGRATTARTGPEGAVPIARGASQAISAESRLPVVTAVSKGSVGGDLPEEAFQRGAPMEPLLPAFRDLSMTPRIAFQGVPSAPSPTH